MASLMEIMQLCRLCLVKDQVNIPIFEEQGDIRQIFLKISACLPVKVSREDNLPKKICDGCSYKLEILYQFWNTSANSEKQLLKWLSQVGAEKSPTSDKVAVAPVQPHSMPSDGVILKQEVVDLADSHSADEIAPDDLNVSSDAQDYILQQQQLPYQPIAFQFPQDGFAEGEGATNASGPSATVTSEAAEATPPKRKRRAAAMKALPPQIDSEEEDEDDVDMVETKIAKTEEQTDESGGEDPEPTAFVGVPSTSTDNEQPGPSGVGKGSAEAPMYGENNSVFGRLVFGPSMSVTVWPNRFVDSPVQPADDSAMPFYAEAGYDNYFAIDDSQNLLQVQDNTKRRRRRKVTKIKEHVIRKKFKIESGIDKSNIIDDKTVRSNVLAMRRLTALKEQRQKKQANKIVKRKKKKNDKPSEAIHCYVCEKTFRNNLSFGLHSIKHNNNEKYACHMCEYKTISKYKFEKHIKAHEGKSGYKCEVCNKSFTVSTHAVEHKYYHTGEKPFKCDICGKDFMYSRFLSSHRRNQHWEILTGLPSARYSCNVCDKEYLSATGLTRHKQRHHIEGFDQSKLCDICGKRLASKDQLKFHRRIHTGYKPYTCTVCSKSFTRKDWLREHERIHTGEKPYTCTYCNKGFTQRSPLKIHERTHTGEKPYVCLMCNRGFISKGIMDTHMKKCEGIYDA